MVCIIYFSLYQLSFSFIFIEYESKCTVSLTAVDGGRSIILYKSIKVHNNNNIIIV